MSSESTLKKRRLESEIKQYGVAVDIPCDRCFWSGCPCVVMDSSKRLKCAECVRQGKACVNLSWESLDRTRTRLRKEIDDDEEELARVMARLMRNKKILRQADDRAKRKAECLASELEAAGEPGLEDCPAADATVGLSPAVWESLAFMESAIDFSGGPSEVASTS